MPLFCKFRKILENCNLCKRLVFTFSFTFSFIFTFIFNSLSRVVNDCERDVLLNGKIIEWQSETLQTSKVVIKLFKF
jgi:hypothetical protein